MQMLASRRTVGGQFPITTAIYMTGKLVDEGCFSTFGTNELELIIFPATYKFCYCHILVINTSTEAANTEMRYLLREISRVGKYLQSVVKHIFDSHLFHRFSIVFPRAKDEFADNVAIITGNTYHICNGIVEISIVQHTDFLALP